MHPVLSQVAGNLRSMTDEPTPAVEMIANLAGEMGAFGVLRGMIFGHRGLKTADRKMFCFEHGDAVVFKLDLDGQAEALALGGASTFSPAGRSPMTGWIVVPSEHEGRWADLAHSALEYVGNG
jgi:hypothetical protein